MNLPPRVGQARISMCRMEMTTCMETFPGTMTTPFTRRREAFA